MSNQAAGQETTQPCGGATGYGCRQPVPAGRGRATGQIWWHRTRGCRAARNSYYHRPADRRTQPCGHCTLPVNPDHGRVPGKTWWHRNAQCNDARLRENSAASRARRAERRKAAA